MTEDGYKPESLAKLMEAIEKEEAFRVKNQADAPSDNRLRMQAKLIDKKLDEAVALEAEGR